MNLNRKSNKQGFLRISQDGGKRGLVLLLALVSSFTLFSESGLAQSSSTNYKAVDFINGSSAMTTSSSYQLHGSSDYYGGVSTSSNYIECTGDYAVLEACGSPIITPPTPPPTPTPTPVPPLIPGGLAGGSAYYGKPACEGVDCVTGEPQGEPIMPTPSANPTPISTPRPVAEPVLESPIKPVDGMKSQVEVVKGNNIKKSINKPIVPKVIENVEILKESAEVYSLPEIDPVCNLDVCFGDNQQSYRYQYLRCFEGYCDVELFLALIVIVLIYALATYNEYGLELFAFAKRKRYSTMRKGLKKAPARR